MISVWHNKLILKLRISKENRAHKRMTKGILIEGGVDCSLIKM